MPAPPSACSPLLRVWQVRRAFLENTGRTTHDRDTAQYEVIARARLDHRLTSADYLDLALNSHSLDKGMRFQRVEDLPDGRIAIVLQHKLSPRKSDEAALMANRSLAQLGIPATKVQQIDLIRLTRKGRTLVRSWVGPGPTDTGSAGDREPRNPLPNPPHLQAERDLPHS